MYLTTNIPHQYLFPHPNNENAVPDHYYSSSEGSDAQSCVAPATAEAFISDGSPNSGIAHLAANDEPYMPPRPQATTTTANPSPLHYTLPPDYVASHIGHSISRDQYREYAEAYDTHTGSYPPQYQHRNTYQQQAPPEDFPYWDDPPYIPPGFTPPPPLALQARSQYTRILPANPPPPPPPSAPPSHTVVPPQSAYGSPSSPSSSESSVASFGQSYAPRHHQYHQHHHHQHHHHLQHQHHQYHQHTPSFSPSPSAIPIQEGGSHASVSPIPVEAHIPPPSLENSHNQQHQQQHQHQQFSQSPIPEPPKGDGEEEEEIPRSRQWHETDKYLRNQIGIPEGTRVDLWALPDPASGQKPQQPLPILVKLAIHGCDKGMLTLQEIYQTLEERFEYFARLKSSAWKNSIRHNLSLNQVFRSCDRPITEPGKGRYWSVDISKGEGYKRERRRKRRNAAPYNGTRDLPGGVGNQLNNNNNNNSSQGGGDSSDGDQDMEDGGGTASMSESVTLKAVPTVMGKKVRGIGGRRGPYTKITVAAAAQPSIPGTTGLTPGGPASTSSVSPTLPTPTAMVYNPNPNSGMAAEPALAAAAASSSSSTSLQVPNAMHDGTTIIDGVVDPSSSSGGPHHHHHHQQHSPAAAAAAVAPQYYQPAYGFTRAAMPTFGQPSLTAPATFFSSSSPSPTRPMGYTTTTTTMEGMMMMNPNPILISSDSGSDSENGRRMMGI